MKVTLKTPTLDLEIDNAKSLDEVLAFIEKFQQLQLAHKKAKHQAALGTSAKGKRSKKRA